MDNEKRNKIIGTIKLRTDKDLRKLLKASEKTGHPSYLVETISLM